MNEQTAEGPFREYHREYKQNQRQWEREPIAALSQEEKEAALANKREYERTKKQNQQKKEKEFIDSLPSDRREAYLAEKRDYEKKKKQKQRGTHVEEGQDQHQVLTVNYPGKGIFNWHHHHSQTFAIEVSLFHYNISSLLSCPVGMFVMSRQLICPVPLAQESFQMNEQKAEAKIV